MTHHLVAALAVTVGLGFLSAGGILVSNWRGWGQRYFDRVIETGRPGTGWYRRGGFTRFRFVLGVGWSSVGIFMILVGVVYLLLS